jgi:hypothetical protein
MDTAKWWEFFNSIPQDIPNEAYDIMRQEMFWKEQAPQLAQKGLAPQASLKNWMDATSRPLTTNFPRATLVGQSIKKGLMAPIAGLTQDEKLKQELAQGSEHARMEAQASGSSPLGIMGMEMVGEGLGMAPYFAAGTGVAGGAVRALASRLGVGKVAGEAAAKAAQLGPDEAMRAGQLAWDTAIKSLQHKSTIPAAGAIQGLYDAARTDEGHRLTEGLKGVAIGTVGGAVFEGILNPRAALRSIHGLSKQEATAIDHTLRGIASDELRSVADNALSRHPNIQGTLEQWLAQSVTLARKTATPRQPIEIEKGSKLSIIMRGSDGAEYPLYNQDPAKIDRMVEVIGKHLDKGGEIVNVKGDANAVNKLYMQFENFARARGEYELPVTIKGADPDAGPLVLYKESSGVEQLSRASSPETAPPGGTRQIGIDQLSPLSYLEQLPDGSILDKKTGARYSSMEIALRANKVKMDVRTQYGSWYTPDGTHLDVPMMDHEGIANQYLHSTGGQRGGSDEMFNIGSIRRATSSLELQSHAISSPGFTKAVSDMWETAQAKGWKKIFIDVLPSEGSTIHGSFTIPTEDIGKLFMDPKGTLREAMKSRKMKADLSSIDTNLPNTPSSIQWRETPTHIRGIGPQGSLPGMPSYNGITQGMGEGNKPLIIYADDMPNPRSTMFHENLHGAMSYTGIADKVNELVPMVPGAAQLRNAFTSDVQKLAGPYINEEIVTHLTSAIRTNDGDKLAQFVHADESLEKVMQVGANLASTVKELAMGTADSTYQRQLIRQMDDVIRRSGTIPELKREIELNGDSLILSDGKFVVRSGNRKQTFTSREALVEYMEQNYREPLNAPNLLDESMLPDMPRFALKDPIQSPPLTTDPLPMDHSGGAPIVGGIHALSYWVRPFYAWLDTVSRKNNYPELYTAFKSIDNKLADQEAFIVGHENKLVEIFKGYKPQRRSDLYHYMETPAQHKDTVAKQLNLTTKEIADANKLRAEFYDPLFQEFGIDPSLYVEEYAPRLRQANGDLSAVRPGGRLSQADIDFFARHKRTGDLDERDTDLLRVSHAYLRIGAKEKFMGADLKRATELVNEKLEDGSFRLGTLQPLLKRHLDFIQHRPDYTQKLVDGAVQSAINLTNEIIGQFNGKMPAAMQLGKIEMPAGDVLGRFLLFSYAGTVGVARPMAFVRDGMQFLMTTYPMLGEQYTMHGLKKAFGALKKGETREQLWGIPEKYGVFQHVSDLRNLYSGGSESLATSKLARASEAAMKPMEWQNNANRLASFWGHADKVFDNIAAFSNQPDLLLKKTGLIYLDKPLQESFMKEITASTPQQWKDISYRAAKELVDVSQWNYRRGAMPGTYKYALGRLFGQYGSWPMNYWEYGRRLLRSGDGADKGMAMARLAAMHTAVLKAGEGTGVDTASWVFTGPASYAGSPLLSSTLGTPTAAFDWQTGRGDDAREQLQRTGAMTVPIVGLAGYQWYKAVTDDNPDEIWKVLLGFNDLTEAELKQGIHNIP